MTEPDVAWRHRLAFPLCDYLMCLPTYLRYLLRFGKLLLKSLSICTVYCRAISNTTYHFNV